MGIKWGVDLEPPLTVGQHFAGRRITLRLETTLAHVVLDGVLTRTIPLTLSPTQCARLHGARTPGPAPLFDQRPTRVQRTVSCRGGTQIIGQRVQVDYVTPGKSSPSKSTRPPCASTTNTIT
jgi:hypothetical protein